jgi:hypothetical protein
MYVVISVVHVNVLGLTLCIDINLIMKFIYAPCKCLISIYICVNVKHETCKYKCKII